MAIFHAVALLSVTQLGLLAVASTAISAPVASNSQPLLQDSQSPPAAPLKSEGIDRSSFRWAQASDQSWILVASIDLAPGWHSYWMNAGDSGNPPSFELTLPKGWRAGKVIYPRPDARMLDGSVFYGYSRSANYLIPVLRMGAMGNDSWNSDDFDSTGGTWKLRAKVMVCKERCVVSTLESSGTWPPVAEAGTGITLNGGSFSGRSLPATAAQAGIFARLEVRKLKIDGPAQGRSTVRFIPAAIPGLQLTMPDGAAAVDGTVSGDRFSLDIDIPSLGSGPGEPGVAGLVLLGNDPSDPCVWLTIAHPLAGPDGTLGGNGVGASDQAPPTK